MRYSVVIAERLNDGDWGVSRHDDDGNLPAGLVQNRLVLYLNKLAGDGWEVVSVAATERSLTVILGKH